MKMGFCEDMCLLIRIGQVFGRRIQEASESVMKEPDVTVTADVKKRLDLTGYEIVRVQYFLLCRIRL